MICFQQTGSLLPEKKRKSVNPQGISFNMKTPGIFREYLECAGKEWYEKSIDHFCILFCSCFMNLRYPGLVLGNLPGFLNFNRILLELLIFLKTKIFFQIFIRSVFCIVPRIPHGISPEFCMSFRFHGTSSRIYS